MGRRCLITGGDSGIGRATAVAFAKEGAASVTIAFLSQEQEDAAETKRVVEKNGARCFLFAGDLANDSVCKALIDDAVANMGGIDVLVNNAAYQGPAVSSIDELDSQRVNYTLQVNVGSFIALSRYALRVMAPGGSIVNLSSVQAYKPSFAILDYACTKGAIATLTQGLAPEALKKGVRVNAVAPGPILTPLICASFDKSKLTSFGEESPMRRPGQPIEVAAAVVFLASNESSYVAGEVMAVTGGLITA